MKGLGMFSIVGILCATFAVFTIGCGEGMSYSEAMGELRQRCREGSQSMPEKSSQSAYYENCIRTGKSIIDQKADELGMAKIE